MVAYKIIALETGSRPTKIATGNARQQTGGCLKEPAEQDTCEHATERRRSSHDPTFGRPSVEQAKRPHSEPSTASTPAEKRQKERQRLETRLGKEWLETMETWALDKKRPTTEKPPTRKEHVETLGEAAVTKLEAYLGTKWLETLGQWMESQTEPTEKSTREELVNACNKELEDRLGAEWLETLGQWMENRTEPTEKPTRKELVSALGEAAVQKWEESNAKELSTSASGNDSE